jgi:tetratricopeptide (TPR) repeat protein
LDKSLEFSRAALAIHRRRGDRLSEAATLNGMGGTYGYLGQPAKALEYFEQAIGIRRNAEGGRRALATSLSNSGQALLSLHQPRKAVAALEEALGLFREMQSRWDQVYTMATLGRGRHELNDLDGAAAMLTDSLKMKAENDDPGVEACTRLDLARLERTRGHPEAALAQITAAIDVFESVRNRVLAPDLRSSLMASVSDYYDVQIDTLMQMSLQRDQSARLEQAREAADRRRARNLIDVLAAAKVSAAPADVALTAQERKLRQDLRELVGTRSKLLRAAAPAADLAAAGRRIDTAWTEYQQVRTKLMSADPMAASLDDPAALSLDTLRREVLEDGTLLLEYSLGKERSFLWAATRDDLRGYELPKRAQIEEAANAFLDAIKSGLEATAMERASARLSGMVLRPAANLLGNRRLLIVADGALQYVPFAALSDPVQTRSYRPLLAAHEIVLEPSASTLASR